LYFDRPYVNPFAVMVYLTQVQMAKWHFGVCCGGKILHSINSRPLDILVETGKFDEDWRRGCILYA